MWHSQGTGALVSKRARGIRAWRLLGLLACLGAACAATAGPARAAANGVCSGTLAAPGTLAGTYDNVTVNGICFVDNGLATVEGNLTITPGSGLAAAFASGGSRLVVDGNLNVYARGTLIMGCEPNFFSCFDDPSNTLTSSSTVQGNLASYSPLGVLVHASTIDGNVTESGGGGGLNCNPGNNPAFAFGVYSDYEDNTVGGNVSISGLHTCWLGALRNNVGKSFAADNNATADPDGNELVSNTITRNIKCTGNNPAVQFGDSEGFSNVVGGNASGQCGFNALQPNPEPNGPLTPISVPMG